MPGQDHAMSPSSEREAAVRRFISPSIMLFASCAVLVLLWAAHQFVLSSRIFTVPIAEARRMQESVSVQLRVRGQWAVERRTKQGDLCLRFQVADESGVTEGVMWQGTYFPETKRLLESGQPIVLSIDVNFFQGKFSPVAKSVRRDPSGEPVPVNEGVLTTSIAEARRMPKGERARLRVRGEWAVERRSCQGKPYLRFKVNDESGIAEGVIWQGTYSPQTKRLLESGEPVFLLIEVDFFRGEFSPIALSVRATP